MSVQLRKPTSSDAEVCGRIIFDAFQCIAREHNFPPDFPSQEVTIGLAKVFMDSPCVFGVVAEDDGRIVGSNFLDERDSIRGVGPITVDPNYQGKGVGRRLMQAVIERAQSAAGIRLVQDAFNTVSMSLYASLGFEVKEPLVMLSGTPCSAPSKGAEVRPMDQEDLAECADICRKIHGFDRTNELKSTMQLGMFRPMVLVLHNEITAYASSPNFWAFNHGVAKSEEDMRELLRGASAASGEPVSLLLPTRQASLFRWCLAEGLRIVKPMTLMAMGEYQEPRGSYFPSVVY